MSDVSENEFLIMVFNDNQKDNVKYTFLSCIFHVSHLVIYLNAFPKYKTREAHKVEGWNCNDE